MVAFLSERVWFPPTRLADWTGLLAAGGDLSVERLRLAYRSGIFPWYSPPEPILWYAPPERMVLLPERLHVGRTIEKWTRRGVYEIRFDTAFEQVMRRCGEVERPGQDGTWISEDMVEGYCALHRAGDAHSVEAWLDGRLVGGAYGVTQGRIFCGESMFSLEPNASKVAFTTLARALFEAGYQLIDCQIYTDHSASFGAVEIPREAFELRLRVALGGAPTCVWPG